MLFLENIEFNIIYSIKYRLLSRFTLQKSIGSVDTQQSESKEEI